MANYPITNRLVENETDLLYKGLPVVTAVNVSSTLFVSPGGNDALAQIGRIDRPYKTLAAAWVAANNVDGSLIWLLPGAYNGGLYADDFRGRRLFMQQATINGDIGTNANVDISGTGDCQINGSLYARNVLTLRGITRLTSSTTIAYGEDGIFIDGVREIISTTTANPVIMRSLASANIKNVNLIRSVNNVFGQGTFKLENIGLVESTANNGAIDYTTDGGYDCYNVTFKSNGYNFAMRNTANRFRNCKFISTADTNFRDCWNSYLDFDNCRFISAIPYHVIGGGGAVDIRQIWYYRCTHNQENFLNASGMNVLKEDFAYNHYYSDLN